jgi:hypothetical protein
MFSDKKLPQVPSDLQLKHNCNTHIGESCYNGHVGEKREKVKKRNINFQVVLK